jgi:predicted metalloprotease with PDZ domain
MILKIFGTVFFVAGLLGTFQSIAQDKYQVNIDLNNVVKDRLYIEIITPEITIDEVEYHIPKIVPGTYSIYDFGRFSHYFHAMDKQGNLLQVDSISPNRRLIKGAKNLAKITYWVDDTFDSKLSNVIFEPAGTSIEAGRNFVINTFGFIGYLDGYKNLPYELNIMHPKKMFGATALEKQILADTLDQYAALNYVDLADGPIMYCKPDTAMINVGGAEILISVYSPNKMLTAKIVSEQVSETLLAQKAYLGDTLPVDKYAFLIYLFEGNSASGGMGALEHSYSSLYSLPDVNPMFLMQAIKDVAAHEFFHIVTPLNIHSEEIGDFDYINPKMSKHLWLYEGMTEYAAGLAQVKYGRMILSTYLDVMKSKMENAERFDDNLPFTEMSKGCLGKYKSQYGNVYEKGALIGMALDIKLRELSNGKYGVQELMKDLSKEYGKTVSFKDEELFDKIVALTYPEIGTFFSDHVAGKKSIPYEVYLSKVGIDYFPPSVKTELSLGNISFSVQDETNRLVINAVDQMNEFGRNLGYQQGDEIVKFDKVEIDIENFEEEFLAFNERHRLGDKITAVVLRTLENGKRKKVKLTAKAVEVKTQSSRSMDVNEDATTEMLELRKSWVGE